MSKKVIREYYMMILGVFCIAFAVEYILLPSKISTGGISSIGVMLYYFFNIPLSLTNILLNSVLFVIGFKSLPKYSIYKTIFGILFFSFALEIINLFPKYSLTLYTSIFIGSIFMGIGIGCVVRGGGSTGGSDFAGIIINKIFPHISIPYAIFCIDGLIILLSGFAFRSFDIITYSIICLYISVKISDAVMCFGTSSKQIFIISDFSNQISLDIQEKIKRGVTGIFCLGMYSKKEKLALLCVVSPREVAKVVNKVRTIDSGAFVVISDVKDVLGEGFSDNKK